MTGPQQSAGSLRKREMPVLSLLRAPPSARRLHADRAGHRAGDRRRSCAAWPRRACRARRPRARWRRSRPSSCRRCASRVPRRSSAARPSPCARPRPAARRWPARARVRPTGVRAGSCSPTASGAACCDAHDPVLRIQQPLRRTGGVAGTRGSISFTAAGFSTDASSHYLFSPPAEAALDAPPPVMVCVSKQGRPRLAGTGGCD